MKSRLFGLFVLGLSLTAMAPITTADDSKNEAIEKDRKQIEGTWRVVAVEFSGNKWTEATAKKFKVVNGSDGTWTLFGEGMEDEIGKGTSSFDPTKTPKTIDFTQTQADGKGVKTLGIYELGENTRRLCFALSDEDRPTEFICSPGTDRVVVAFEREKDAFQAVECEGSYPHHLQGVCTNERDAIYWCFTTKLVKTDRSGKVLKQIDVANHHGDLCFHDGKVFVAVNFGKFNDADGNADSWVYAYDAGDLTLLAKHPTPEVIFGAGGIAYHEGRFVVVGGLPERFKGNNAYEYDANFKFVKLHRLKSLATHLGIQTAAFADGHWWFGCYGDPRILLKEDELFAKVGKRFECDCSLGIVPVGNGKFLVARGTNSKERGHTGRLELAETDNQQGLKLLDDSR